MEKFHPFHDQESPAEKIARHGAKIVDYISGDQNPLFISREDAIKSEFQKLMAACEGEQLCCLPDTDTDPENSVEKFPENPMDKFKYDPSDY